MSEYPEVDRLDKIHRAHAFHLYALRDAADSVDTAARILRQECVGGDIVNHTTALLEEFHVAVARAQQAEREAAKAVNAAYRAATGDTKHGWTT